MTTTEEGGVDLAVFAPAKVADSLGTAITGMLDSLQLGDTWTNEVLLRLIGVLVAAQVQLPDAPMVITKLVE